MDRVHQRLGVSERRACRVLGQARATQRHRTRVPDDEPRLVHRIVELATQYGRYGDGWSLRPLYPDAFTGRSSLVGEFQGARQMGIYVFRRDGGRVSEFSLIQSRVWDLRFERQR